MKHIFTIAIALVLASTAFAHSNEEIENTLIDLHGQIEKYSSYSSEYSDDRDSKLSKANKAFRTRLLQLTSQHASMLKYGFPKLRDKIQIKASPDSALKVYSWDTLSGGTMHFYDRVFQFRGVDGVFSRNTFNEEGDASGFVNEVFDIETKTGTVYLVCSTTVLSTSYRGQALFAFQVDGNNLSDGVKIIKTSSGTTDSLSFGYDFFSVVDRKERPVRLFEYDRKSKTISFPVVIEDQKTPQGRVTSSKIKYRFDGEHFVRVKN
jgi:hypothetical protein